MFGEKVSEVLGITVRERRDGSIELSDVVRAHRVSKVYYGWELGEAIAAFKEENGIA